MNKPCNITLFNFIVIINKKWQPNGLSFLIYFENYLVSGISRCASIISTEL